MYTTEQYFTLRPLTWVLLTKDSGHQRLVANSARVKLSIVRSQFDNTYDVDMYAGGTYVNLEYALGSLAEAKTKAWGYHCNIIRDFIIPVVVEVNTGEVEVEPKQLELLPYSN